jgi:hypothetical protein
LEIATDDVAEPDSMSLEIESRAKIEKIG